MNCLNQFVSVAVLLTSFPLVAAVESNICGTPELTKQTNTNYLKYCVTDCLGLIERKAPEDCKFDRNGKVVGCSGKFSQLYAKTAKGLVICDGDGFERLKGSLWNLRACDMVYFYLFTVDAAKSVVNLKKPASANESVQLIETYRKMDIKILGIVGYQETAALNQVSSSQEPRKKFAESVAQHVQNLNLDGIFLSWKWPKCLQSNCIRSAGTVSLLTELGKQLKETGKILAIEVSANPEYFHDAGDYYSAVVDVVDYFAVDTPRPTNEANYAATFSFDLKNKMKAVETLLSKVDKSSAVATKMLFSFNTMATKYQLKVSNNDAKIGSASAKSSTMKVIEWCKFLKPSSEYILTKSTETQNHAVKGTDFLVYDDVDSMNAKIMAFTDFGAAGIHVFNVVNDDAQGKCGCGEFPFVRTLAELLKYSHCLPSPCF